VPTATKPAQKRHPFPLVLQPYQRALLDRAAERLCVSRTEVIRRALEHYVANLNDDKVSV
jgi:uncharacterized protein (DUF1778 family)